MGQRSRILAVHPDAAYLQSLAEALRAVEVDVYPLPEATRVVPVARELEPHLILLGQDLTILTGAEVVRSLRAFEETEEIPTVLTLENGTETELLRALRAGATDALPMPFQGAHVPRLQQMIDDFRSRNVHAPAVPRNALLTSVLRLYRVEHRHGTLLVNPGTPFEGRAAFDHGELVGGEFGPLQGEDALREMLGLEEGTWRFIHGRIRPSRPEPEAAFHSARPRDTAAAYRPRVLIVDDEPSLRRLFDIQLTQAGFETAVAEDGERGFEAAIHFPYDVILADLSMPRLDGWGLLHKLKADQRTREVPLVFVSAHDDYLEALKSARAGAADYLPKTGRADVIIPRLNRLLAPRHAFWAGLATPGVLDVQAHQLGIQWLLRALARGHATGELQLRDDWGLYRLTVDHGIPVAAHARVGRRDVTGLSAAASLLVSTGADGTFAIQAVQKGAPLAASMETLIHSSGDVVNRLDAEILKGKLAQGARLEVDTQLYRLFRRVGREQVISLARALIEDEVPVPSLSQALSLTADQVASGLTELIGRGVIRFATDPTPVIQ